MNKKKLIILTLVNYLLIAIVIYIIMTQFNLPSLSIQIRSLSVPLLMLYSLIFGVVMTLKVIRTTYLVGHDVGARKNLQIIGIGNMLNTVLPLRIGDTFRGLALSDAIQANSSGANEENKVEAYGKGFALTILEKVVDLIILLVIGMLLLSLNIHKLIQNDIIVFAFLGSIVLVFSFGFLLLLTKRGSLVNQMIKYVFEKLLPDRLTKYFVEILKSGRDQIYVIIRDRSKLPGILVLSTIVMMGDIGLVMLVIFGTVEISIQFAILSAVVGFISVVLPSLPAGIGPYQFGIAIVIALSGNSLEIGLQIGLIELFLRSIHYVFIGSIELGIFGIHNTQTILEYD